MSENIVTETVTETLLNGNTIEYKIVNGTAYRKNTPMEVVNILEFARVERKRIRVFYGDTETGRDWMEEYGTIGTIGRSTGRIKIPLLIRQSNSRGGGSVLDDCIVKITMNGVTLYQHPNYHQPELIFRECEDPLMLKEGYTAEVLRDGEVTARFRKEEQAKRWIAFMKGERNSK